MSNGSTQLCMSFLSLFSKQAPAFLVRSRLFLRKSEKNILAFLFLSLTRQANGEEEKAKMGWQLCERMCQVASTGLRFGDFDRKRSMLTVTGKGSKERRIALGNNCLRNLLYYPRIAQRAVTSSQAV
jgi:site-specific recombinase XerC